jgi:serine/threonine protein kinase
MSATIPPGTRLDRYEIISKIGAGGMGVVYLAQDTKLERTVALKVLTADVANDQLRMQRFIQEAKAASALNHPNILTIHEIGSIESTNFIATEYIDGIPLRQHLNNTQMSIAEAVDVAIQVASALAEAHKFHIVHRDIKPENIMLRRDGYVKVLDFGLAKLLEQPVVQPKHDLNASTFIETEPGIVMGTVTYMSPEQARGLPVDGRSDIWSLGIVLYEMVADRPPFKGETASDVISLILQKPLPPLERFEPDVPAELERIIMKALMKDREERYQTARDLFLDLKQLKQRLDVDAELKRNIPSGIRERPDALASGSQTTADIVDRARSTTGELRTATTSAEYIVGEIKKNKRVLLLISLAIVAIAAAAYFYFASRRSTISSVAVMPFVNASADPNVEYLSDGITETLINSLTHIPDLRIVARSTVFRYKGKEIDPQTVGTQLGVQALMTGSVRQQGDILTIQVELVDTTNGSQLWGQQYQRKVSDLLEVQQDISREVSKNLRLRLTGEEEKQLTKRYTENTQAYQVYLQGRYYWNKRTPEGLNKSIEYFQQAIAADPNYALAYGGLADSYNVLSTNNILPPREAFPKAKAAVTKALEIDDTLAEAHTSLAFIRTVYDWDWPGAEQEYKRAIALNPNYANAHYFYAFTFLISQGRVDEAIAEMKRAVELDPLSLIINTNLGRTYFLARQYDKALEQYRKTLDLEPTFPRAHDRLQEVYEQKGAYNDAIADMEKVNPAVGARVRAAFEKAGPKGYWQERISLDQEQSQRTYSPAYFTAAKYAALGDNGQALTWLEKAYADRDTWLISIKIDPIFDGIRSDPRFVSLLRNMKLE